MSYCHFFGFASKFKSYQFLSSDSNFIFKTKADINPFDITDQVAKELASLKAIVQGQIGMAHNNLDSHHMTYQTQSYNKEKLAQIDLAAKLQTAKNQIQTLKNLAASAGVDATTCTDIREKDIESLQLDYVILLVSCISNLNTQAAIHVQDSTYMVDIIFNKVTNLEFQLELCQGQLSCLSPILTLIQSYNIKLPQEIQLEVANAKTYLETLLVPVGQCSDTKVASFINEVNTVLAEIEACINKILG